MDWIATAYGMAAVASVSFLAWAVLDLSEAQDLSIRLSCRRIWRWRRRQGDQVAVGVAHLRQRGIVALVILAKRDAGTLQPLALGCDVADYQKQGSVTREIGVGRGCNPP